MKKILLSLLVFLSVTTFAQTKVIIRSGALDTTSLSNRINTKLNASDTASLSARINTKLNASDTTNYVHKNFSINETVTGRKTFNATTLINKDSLLIQSNKVWTVMVDTTNNNLTRMDISGYNNEDYTIPAYQALGSVIVAQPVGYNATLSTGGAANLLSQRIVFEPIYIPKPMTITGFKWLQGANGAYNQANENRLGLYSYDGAGTMNLVASTTNDTALWKGGTGIRSKALSGTYAAAKGLYYIGILYCNASQTTAPAVYAVSQASGTALTLDFSNSAKWIGVETSITTLPTSKAMSALTAHATTYAFFLY